MVAYTAFASLLAAFAASAAAAPAPTGDDHVLVARGLQADVAIQYGRDAWLVAQPNIVPDNCPAVAEKDFGDKAQKLSDPGAVESGWTGFSFWSEGDGYWYRAEPNGSGNTMDVMYQGKKYGICEKPTPVECNSHQHQSWRLKKVWYCTFSY